MFCVEKIHVIFHVLDDRFRRKRAFNESMESDHSVLHTLHDAQYRLLLR